MSLLLAGPFQLKGHLFLPCFIAVPVFNGNIVDPDQTPPNTA